MESKNLENIQKGISDTLRLFLSAEVLEDAEPIRERTREVIRDLRSSPELIAYMGSAYKPFMEELGKGEIQSSHFFGKMYELGHILGVVDLPGRTRGVPGRNTSGYYIGREKVQANDPRLIRVDKKPSEVPYFE